jgi:hypothetical protein
LDDVTELFALGIGDHGLAACHDMAVHRVAFDAAARSGMVPRLISLLKLEAKSVTQRNSRFRLDRRMLVRLRWLQTCLARCCPRARDRIFAVCGGRVTAGPFRGMRYLDRAVGSALPPKLLGTYEQERHPWIEEIAGMGYEDVHVVGCAEGYYAVGLALRTQGCRVFAYDLDPSAARLLRRLAARNGVGPRVEFRGGFSPASIFAPTTAPTLVICDTEGAELELLDPRRAPSLLRADILVEVHDAATGTIEQLLRERFEATHRIRRLAAVPRSIRDVRSPLPLFLRRQTIECSIDEGRKLGLTWLFMTAGQPACSFDPLALLSRNLFHLRCRHDRRGFLPPTSPQCQSCRLAAG